MTMSNNSPLLALKNVSFRYEQHAVLEDVSLEVARGETVAILGRSGVGKSTLFNLIASVLPLQSGTINYQHAPIEKGMVSYMLQKDLLLPHKTVIDNIVLPLLLQGIPYEKALEQSQKLLQQFQLQKWANYYPHALSGGMRQRIAFIRTANFQRELVLLDEAFSALDAVTRREMHEWYLDYQKQMNWTTLLITHDVEEALMLSQRVYVLSGQPGKITTTVSVELDDLPFKQMPFDRKFLDYKKQLLDALS